MQSSSRFKAVPIVHDDDDPTSSTSVRRLALQRTPPVIVKRCSCGLAYDNAGWRQLAFCGFMQKNFDDATDVLELRQCRCGSTISRDVQDPTP